MIIEFKRVLEDKSSPKDRGLEYSCKFIDIIARFSFPATYII